MEIIIDSVLNMDLESDCFPQHLLVSDQMPIGIMSALVNGDLEQNHGEQPIVSTHGNNSKKANREGLFQKGILNKNDQQTSEKKDDHTSSSDPSSKDLQKGSVPPQTLGVEVVQAHVVEGSSDDGSAFCTQSPKSPGSIFTTSELEDSAGSCIAGILLCYWDNIMGPKIRHLWQNTTESVGGSSAVDIQGGQGSLLARKNLLYVASHTLSGEICRNLLVSTVDSKFYVLHERGLALTSFVFGGMAKGDLAVHSLSVLLSHSQLRRYLRWHQLINTYMTRTVPKLRILLEKLPLPSAISEFSVDLHHFVQLLKSLHEAALPAHIPLSDTLLQHSPRPEDAGLLRQAITCHLVTCGHSLIVGRSPSKVNKMIATLALFLRPEERLCSRYVVPDRSWLYQPDLWLQGIIKHGSDSDLSECWQRISLSRYPTALIDLTSGEVKLSCFPHQHWHRWQDALQQQVTALWKGQAVQNPTSDLFHILDDPETLVGSLLEELMVLPPNHGLRVQHTENFMRLLERKALTLLKYLDTECRASKIPLKSQVKRIKHDLSLTVPGDFRIVMAIAEKMQPGISAIVCGTSRTDSSMGYPL